MAESFSRKKLRQAPQKEGGEILCDFCFLLDDPGWYVHKPDVQNKWDGITHTHTQRMASAPSLEHTAVRTFTRKF